ncbi:hypothetical protein [Synechococcus phage Ssp-JY38]|nr:hypothetical protein [Synechococcus phage Yong-L2-223]
MTRPATQRRFVPHPGVLVDPDHYAMMLVEGHKTRAQVKAETFHHVYSSGPRPMREAFKELFTTLESRKNNAV